MFSERQITSFPTNYVSGNTTAERVFLDLWNVDKIIYVTMYSSAKNSKMVAPLSTESENKDATIKQSVMANN